MITLVRSVKTRALGSDALWAKEAADYVGSLDSSISLQVVRERFGERAKIYWVVSGFEDLAALDAWQKKLLSDEGYIEQSKNVSEFIVEGSLYDKVLETVE